MEKSFREKYPIVIAQECDNPLEFDLFGWAKITFEQVPEVPPGVGSIEIKWVTGNPILVTVSVLFIKTQVCLT